MMHDLGISAWLEWKKTTNNTFYFYDNVVNGQMCQWKAGETKSNHNVPEYNLEMNIQFNWNL